MSTLFVTTQINVLDRLFQAMIHPLTLNVTPQSPKERAMKNCWKQYKIWKRNCTFTRRKTGTKCQRLISKHLPTTNYTKSILTLGEINSRLILLKIWNSRRTGTNSIPSTLVGETKICTIQWHQGTVWPSNFPLSHSARSLPPPLCKGWHPVKRPLWPWHP